MKAARLALAVLVALALGVAPAEARHGPVVAHRPTVTVDPALTAVHFRATLRLPYRAHGAVLRVCPRFKDTGGQVREFGCGSTTVNRSVQGTFLTVTRTVPAVHGSHPYWSVADASWVERTPRRKLRPGREDLRYHTAVSPSLVVTR